MEHWKQKWRALRNLFRAAMKSKSMRQSAILNAMEFMRPILTETMSASHEKKRKNLAAEPVQVLVATSTKPIPIDQQPLVSLYLKTLRNHLKLLISISCRMPLALKRKSRFL